MNAKLGFEQEDWDVFLRGENLGDVEYLENIAYTNDSGQEFIFSTVGKPRTISLVASARF